MVASEPFDELARDAARFHRYLLVRELARGRDVLEVGIGDGAGSCLVAGSARSVTGWDPSRECVAWARQRSAGSGAEFIAGDLSDHAADSADLILALEPAVWRDDPAGFHTQACRILRPGGMMLLAGLTEGTVDPLVALLRGSHPHVAALAQKPLLGSLLLQEPGQDRAGPPLLFERMVSGDITVGTGLSRPGRILWLASDTPVCLPAVSAYVESSDICDRERQWRLRLAEREAAMGIWLDKARRERDAARRTIELNIQKNAADRAQRDREVAEQLENAARETRQVARELADEQVRLADERAHVADMKASTSWRLTAPLRAIVSRIRPRLSPASAEAPEVVTAVEAVEVELPAPSQAQAPTESTPAESLAAADVPAVAEPVAVDRLRQRRSLGLDLPLPSWKVSVLLAAETTTPRQIERCLASAETAMEHGGLSGEILLTGSPSARSARSLRDEGGLSLAQAHNLLLREAFAEGADIGVIADIGGLFHPKSLRSLLGVMAAHDGVALVEASLFPEEHPKVFDRETLQTAWAASRCLAISRQVFERIGGFDGNFRDAGQDIDYSWRARAHGIPVLTAPHALFLLDIGPEAFELEQVRARLAGGVLLARKWGAPDFEYAASSELERLGGTAPAYVPDLVPADWRAIPDFAHQFAFSQTRWFT